MRKKLADYIARKTDGNPTVLTIKLLVGMELTVVAIAALVLAYSNAGFLAYAMQGLKSNGARHMILEPNIDGEYADKDAGLSIQAECQDGVLTTALSTPAISCPEQCCIWTQTIKVFAVCGTSVKKAVLIPKTSGKKTVVSAQIDDLEEPRRYEVVVFDSGSAAVYHIPLFSIEEAKNE